MNTTRSETGSFAGHHSCASKRAACVAMDGVEVCERNEAHRIRDASGRRADPLLGTAFKRGLFILVT
jgi:hypothetical protein